MSSITKINLENLVAVAPKFSGTGKFAPSKVRIGEKPLSVKLVGSVFMAPRKQVGDYGTQYSMGVKFNESDMIVFDTLLEKMGQFAGDGFRIKHAHENGKIFIKLVPNDSGSKFKFKCNLPLTPQNLLDIEKKSDVTIELGVDGWYLKDGAKKTFGLTLDVNKIFFGHEPKPRSKKRKTSEDEVSSPDSN